VAVDDRLNPADYCASNGYTFTGVLDIDGAEKYGVRSIPFSVFIDRNGNQVSATSYISPEEIEAELRKIL
jgi:thioredoxin-related protein